MHVAYWDEKAGNQVVYRRGVPTGGGWGQPHVMSSLGFTHPEAEGTNRPNPGLAEDDSSGVRIFFSENASVPDSLSIGRLFYRSSGDGGLTWNSSFQLGADSLGASPQAVYEDGRVRIVWVDYRDNNYGSEIYYRFLELTLSSLVDHYYTSILKRLPDSGGE